MLWSPELACGFRCYRSTGLDFVYIIVLKSSDAMQAGDTCIMSAACMLHQDSSAVLGKDGSHSHKLSK